MFRVREVNREQHIMTSTFLGWVAYQLSSHWLSALTYSPETPGNLLSEGEGPNNMTITKYSTSCTPSIITVHGQLVTQSAGVIYKQPLNYLKRAVGPLFHLLLTASQLKCERPSASQATTTNSVGIKCSPSQWHTVIDQPQTSRKSVIYNIIVSKHAQNKTKLVWEMIKFLYISHDML